MTTALKKLQEQCASEVSCSSFTARAISMTLKNSFEKCQ